MLHYIAVFTFLIIVGVCSYVVLNPASYSILVLCFASFTLCVASLAVAPVWKVIFSLRLTRRNDCDCSLATKEFYSSVSDLDSSFLAAKVVRWPFGHS
jgi:hypothetical protein